jgi:YgiT-type zinc finger domain-containing protein
MIKITECPTCGSKKIKKVRRNSIREYREQKYTVPSQEFYECPDCGEELYDHQAMQKIEEYSPAYGKVHVGK